MSLTPRCGYFEVDICSSPCGTDGRRFLGPYCSKPPGHQLGCRYDLDLVEDPTISASPEAAAVS